MVAGAVPTRKVWRERCSAPFRGLPRHLARKPLLRQSAASCGLGPPARCGTALCCSEAMLWGAAFVRFIYSQKETAVIMARQHMTAFVEFLRTTKVDSSIYETEGTVM